MSDHQPGTLRSALRFPALLVGAMWAVHIISWMLNLKLGFLGVMPRSLSGLPGIVTTPFIHGGWDHIISNSLPFFFLCAAILYFYRRIAAEVIALVWLLTGALVWAFAVQSNSTHIGASGLVYGFAFFLFFSGVFRKDFQSIVIALLVVFLYGGMIWGVFPGQEGVSWESHLAGALTGLMLAYVYRHKALPPRKKYTWEDEPDSDEGDSSAYWNYRKGPPL